MSFLVERPNNQFFGRVQIANNSLYLQSQCKLSLLNLPIEVLHEIVYWLTEGYVNLNSKNKFQNNDVPSYSYVLNHIKSNPECFPSLLALSSTCSTLRVLLGQILFSNLSLVRENQIDTLLSNPKVLEQFSDKKRYHRELIKEILDYGFQDCLKSDLAKNSFKIGVNGDTRFKSQYQRQYSINNFVSYLECDNSSLKSSDLYLFPNITGLKVLDSGITDPLDSLNGVFRNLYNLEFLSINALTLINLKPITTLLPQLKRLDVLCDFNELDPDNGLSTIKEAFTKQENKLEELNYFMNDACVITYQETLEFLHSISDNCPKLLSLNIRIIRRKGPTNIHNNKWKIYNDEKRSDALTLIHILNSCISLQHVGFDLRVFDVLNVPYDTSTSFDENMLPKPKRKSDDLCLTLVELSMSTPKLVHKLRNAMRIIVHSLHITQLNFQFGEVIDQSHIQALNLVTNFVEYLSIPCDSPKYYQEIKKISTEKCWSVTDDSIRRDYYHSGIFELDQSDKISAKAKILKRKLALASVWGRLPFNSPRYKIRESYDVFYNRMPLGQYLQQLQFPPAESGSTFFSNPEMQQLITIPTYKSTVNDTETYASSKEFWSVETSLTELEQYSVKQKKLSSIWGTPI